MSELQILKLYHWRLAEGDGPRRVFRPGPVALCLHLLCMLVCLGAMAWMVHSIGRPSALGFGETGPQPSQAEQAKLEELRKLSEEAKKLLEAYQSEAEAEALQQELKQEHAERAAARPREADRRSALERVAPAAYTLFLGLCLFVGLAAPLSCIWQSVTIERDVHNQLRVKKVGIVPTARSVSFQNCTVLAPFVEEVIETGQDGPRMAGWRWRVQLHGTDERGQALMVEFWPLMEKDPPALLKYLPDRVKTLTNALEEMTGLKANPAAKMKTTQLERGLFGDKLTSVGVSTSPGEPSGQPQTFSSLEEVPPHLRPKLEEMMQQTGSPGEAVQGSMNIRVQDAQGNTHAYHSLEEMPPEVRAAFEKAQRARGGE